MADGTTRVSKLRRLSGWQWRVIFSTPFVLMLTTLRLRFGGLRRTLARSQRPPETAPVSSASDSLALARDTAFALAVAVKYGPWWPRCLVRSLALAWYLGRIGIPFEVRIGLPADTSAAPAPDDPDFTAHAWVEHAGEVLNDRADIAQTHRAFDIGAGPV